MSKPENTEASTSTVLSFGEKAVGLTFNPSGDDGVAELKRRYAKLIDNVNAAREDTTEGEEKRMYSLAITHLQEAQMWTTKAQTWRK